MNTQKTVSPSTLKNTIKASSGENKNCWPEEYFGKDIMGMNPVQQDRNVQCWNLNQGSPSGISAFNSKPPKFHTFLFTESTTLPRTLHYTHTHTHTHMTWDTSLVLSPFPCGTDFKRQDGKFKRSDSTIKIIVPYDFSYMWIWKTHKNQTLKYREQTGDFQRENG